VIALSVAVVLFYVGGWRLLGQVPGAGVFGRRILCPLMKSHEQLHLAGILAECSKRLEGNLRQLGFEERDEESPEAQNSGDGSKSQDAAEPDDPLAAIDVVAKRVIDVEHALREDLDRRKRRSLRTVLRQWTSPRLGILRHHMPEPLRVPTRYLRTQPPRDAPTISIVTPSYEQGRYLERTMYSVLNQNYPNLEYVVQDGGSSDETREVLEHFGGSLSHWASEPDDGQADAINRGFAHTSGEIMAYLNSDDLLLPGSLAYVARYFAAHPRVDAVYGHRILIDEHDGQIGAWVLPRHDDRTLTFADYIPQETLFWRQELWERAGGRIDASLKFAVDWDLLLRFREAGARIVRLPRFLGAFRVHAEQKTGREQRLCDAESELLRRRVLGRAMGDEEVYVRVRPYLRRHVLHHTVHRLKERLPLPRSYVRTVPLEAAVKRETVSPFDMR
jgi:glycosyltransferase involved in cell wall biosynthesis